MTYRHIAIMGKARSGKDSLAAELIRRYAFTRLAFADPLREAALKLDPIITTDAFGPVRLSEVLEQGGWERAKDEYPEIRRVLQRMGQGVRDMDEDFWLNVLLRKADGADKLNMPVVVTDVRYPNEAEALKARGFLMLRIVRGGHGCVSARYLQPNQEQLAAHISETALDDFAADLTLPNNGTLFSLQAAAADIVELRRA